MLVSTFKFICFFTAKEDDGMSAISVLAVGVFLWAFIHQFRCATILANLRKNSQGLIIFV
jgi:hypothetical protein